MGTKDGQREQQEQIRNNKTWEIKLKTRHKQLKAVKIKVEITPRQRLDHNKEQSRPCFWCGKSEFQANFSTTQVIIEGSALVENTKLLMTGKQSRVKNADQDEPARISKLNKQKNEARGQTCIVYRADSLKWKSLPLLYITPKV